ncbi:SUI1 family translation initiation factor [Haloferax larsenii]|uniref:Protein translation factor SUI1 homolog n=1 Tax=Haloferax larsenii TaxID=302484 RepID=A0A1H7NR24_HALLR|nr:translation initiation factor [Haloferax larsenii]ELZ80869.1 translation initiation factor Sui1 [Haloferax larsenii JCM 13917]UVE51060.1 translation initiation factor [Haloferax larsenii]SEL25739.1 translation initiation factor 1 (eIF-1/SUI1) [Haloferax larsenii]
MAKDTFSDITGLPDDLGIEDDLARSNQRASIRVDTRRYGKPVTIVAGLDLPADELASLASTLKRHLAVGGTVSDDGAIELQGEHGPRLEAALRDEGFDVET